MKNAVIYIHGKGGSADEAHHYRKFFNDDYEVMGFDYKSELPWDVKEEFQNYFDDMILKYNEIILIGNSVGAYFALLSLAEKMIKKALFISPIVDMEKLITDIMERSDITENELKSKKKLTRSMESLYLGNICFMYESIRLSGIYPHVFYMGRTTI